MVFCALIQKGYFKETFLSITPQELVSIEDKKHKYKVMKYKSAYVNYILLTVLEQKWTDNFKNIFKVYSNYQSWSLIYKNTFKKTYNQISDFDNIIQEIIEVQIIKLFINMRINFASQDK